MRRQKSKKDYQVISFGISIEVTFVTEKMAQNFSCYSLTLN